MVLPAKNLAHRDVPLVTYLDCFSSTFFISECCIHRHPTGRGLVSEQYIFQSYHPVGSEHPFLDRNDYFSRARQKHQWLRIGPRKETQFRLLNFCTCQEPLDLGLILGRPDGIFEHLVRRHRLAISQLFCRFDPRNRYTILCIGTFGDG